MTERLGADARELVRAAREFRAPSAERDALWERLGARIAAGDPGPAMATSKAGSTGTAVWITAAVVAGGIAAALLWPGSPGSDDGAGSERRPAVTATRARPVEEPEVPPAAVAPRAAVPDLPAGAGSRRPADAPTSEPAVPTPRPAPSRKPVLAAPPPGRAHPEPAPSSLAQETRLLSQAQAALASGALARALGLVERHGRRFPTGQLRSEFAAVRVLALCQAQRWDEGGQAAAEFVERWPRSPLAPSVRAACD